MGERASSRYRSTSPVRRADRAFDCGERWVRVDGRVCELMYVSCYCTAREEKFLGDLFGGRCVVRILLVTGWIRGRAIRFRVACAPQMEKVYKKKKKVFVQGLPSIVLRWW